MEKYFVSFLISLCISSVAIAQEGKYKWDRFHSSDFPAYVEAIIFSTEQKLSSSSSLKWGNWTIYFPSGELPVAKGVNGGMTIEGLKASNPVEGWGFACEMYLFGEYKIRYEGKKLLHKRNCKIYIKNSSGGFLIPSIEIECPVDVQMKR